VTSSSEYFEQMAATAQVQAQREPEKYRRKLMAMALLGYAAIVLALFLFLGLTGGLVALAVWNTALFLLLLKKKLLLLCIPAVWVLLKSLWIRIEAPQGTQIARKQFPLLFRDIEKLRQQLDAPKIHRVVVTPEFNAGIAQTPRLGILGWHKNTLVLGMELLMVLSRQQVNAVIAHELGHLSGNHSRFNAWIYRVRTSWWLIMDSFAQQGGWSAKLMGRFFSWYAPRFAAYSFALAQQNEYEADACSKLLCGGPATAAALVNTYATGPYLDKTYWQQFFAEADNKPEPASGPWTGFAKFVAEQSFDKTELKQNLEQALKYKTDFEDTHPALKDRLKALGAKKVGVVSIEKSAAQEWFAGQLPSILQLWDQDWMLANLQGWRERYDYAQQAKKDLLQLRTSDVESLDLDALAKRAQLEEEFGDTDQAAHCYQRWFERDHNNLSAAFALGRLHFNNDNEPCLHYFNLCLADATLATEAFEFIHAYLTRHDRHSEIEHFKRIAQKQFDELQLAQIERQEVAPGDQLCDAKLSTAFRQHLQELLAAEPKIKSAWIAQKVVNHMPEAPVYIVTFKLPAFCFASDKITEQLLANVQPEDKAIIFFVPKNSDYRKLANKVIKAGQQLL